jgi:hypothetical protein
MVAIILEILFSWMTNVSFANILNISVAVTLLSYLIADLFILSKTNNTVATISDVILSIIVIMSFNYVYDNPSIDFVDAIVASVVIGLGELAFHKYLSEKVFPEKRSSTH